LAATGRKSGLADRIERLVETGELRENAPDGRGLRRPVLIVAVTVLGLVTCCIPRVQLAGAASAGTHKAQSEQTREKDSTQTFVEANEESVGSAADGAKPQAHGESNSRNESILNVPTDESPAASARNVSRESAPADVAALLKQLDGDLRDLERELAELESLLKEQTSTAVARLAKQLRVEIGRLKERRQILQVKSRTISKIARRD
jgi:hypothetical protein